MINPDLLDPESQQAFLAENNNAANNDNEGSVDSVEDHRKNRGSAGAGGTNSAARHVFINQEGVNVTFRIMGFTEESVDMVIEHLERIIKGE